jgi:hypothetical protein
MFQWSPLTVMGCLGSTLYPTTIGPKNTYCRDISIYILYHLIPPIYLRLYIYIYTYMYIYIYKYTHTYIYTHIYIIHIIYPQISWCCSQISPLPQGLHHRDGALVLRAQRQGRSRSWRGRSLVPTNPLGCHLALNWAWWLATCLEKMAVSIGKMLITIKSGGKPFSDKPNWRYEHLFKKYKHVWTMIYEDIGSKMESHETIEPQQV